MIPIDHQPPGYWATNLYASPRKRPKSDAPIKDLPPRAAQRFKRAREGIRALRHVTEQVVFMGTAWKWVWMYEVGGRKLGYLHPSALCTVTLAHDSGDSERSRGCINRRPDGRTMRASSSCGVKTSWGFCPRRRGVAVGRRRPSVAIRTAKSMGAR